MWFLFGKKTMHKVKNVVSPLCQSIRVIEYVSLVCIALKINMQILYCFSIATFSSAPLSFRAKALRAHLN